MNSAETESALNQAAPNRETATDQLRSPEDNARLVMHIFVDHFKLLTGESLLTNKLSSVWYEQHKSQEDLVSGLAFAKNHEWITALDEAFRLTEAGFAIAKGE